MPSSFSPKTGYLYIPAHNTCMDYEGNGSELHCRNTVPGRQRAHVSRGRAATRANSWRGTWRSEEGMEHEGDGFSGLQWRALNRGRSGLLRHHGRMVPRRRRPHRQDSVAVQNGSGIIGNPMTFTGPDGKQYVADLLGHRRLDGRGCAAVALHRRSLRGLGAVGAMKKIKVCDSAGRHALCVQLLSTARPRRWFARCARGLSSAQRRCECAPIQITCPYSNDQQQGFENGSRS